MGKFPIKLLSGNPVNRDNGAAPRKRVGASSLLLDSVPNMMSDVIDKEFVRSFTCNYRF